MLLPVFVERKLMKRTTTNFLEQPTQSLSLITKMLNLAIVIEITVLEFPTE